MPTASQSHDNADAQPGRDGRREGCRVSQGIATGWDMEDRAWGMQDLCSTGRDYARVDAVVPKRPLQLIQIAAVRSFGGYFCSYSKLQLKPRAASLCFSEALLPRLMGIQLADRTGRKVIAPKAVRERAVAIKQLNPTMTNAAIAERLGVTPRQVQSWLSRTRDQSKGD